MLERFQGKVAVVTGASRGIGRAVALRLAHEGASVFCTYLRQSSSASSALDEELKGTGSPFASVAADLRTSGAADAIIGTAVEAFGQVDFLVLNAGTYEPKTLDELTPALIDAQTAINVRSSLLLVQRFVRAKAAGAPGRVVFISSILARTGYPRSAHYVAAKAAVEGLVRSLALELAPEITVNGVVPGFIRTDRLASESIAQRAARTRRIPLGRLGESTEVASLIIFLLSPEADYITGEVIAVAGGYPIP